LDLKEKAAREAVGYVNDGMVVGLGSGSTASIAIRILGERVKDGMRIVGIPTSTESENLGKAVGIKIGELRDYPIVNLTIDGADEVDPDLNLIKGLGGALVREKIVASATEMEIIVVDDSKLVDYLGQKTPLPVEIVKFAHDATVRRLREFGCEPKLRAKDGQLFVTDNGNYIADCRFKRIDDPRTLEAELNLVPGVVDNGLFVGMADRVIVSSKDGIRKLEKKI
jgi:ribose 5-phosphate isomerase A